MTGRIPNMFQRSAVASRLRGPEAFCNFLLTKYIEIQCHALGARVPMKAITSSGRASSDADAVIRVKNTVAVAPVNRARRKTLVTPTTPPKPLITWRVTYA